MINSRKLTAKSMMLFGKYKELTVHELILLKKQTYLRWVYYNCSHINYFDNILDAINIPENWRIDKPGINPDMHYELLDFLAKKCRGMDKLKRDKKKAKMLKICDGRVSRLNYNTEKKSVLQARNHGHNVK